MYTFNTILSVINIKINNEHIKEKNIALEETHW